jgi:chemotaxis protein MotB
MADTLDTLSDGPTIIRKTIRLPEEPHGGAWKVAYADFVTAMMAFFLLLWLLNVTTEDTKRGISDFFEPVGVTDQQTGSGGALKGLAMAAKGALRSAGSPPRVVVPIPTFGGRDAGTSEGKHAVPNSQGGGTVRGPNRLPQQARQQNLSKVAAALRQALQDIPELSREQDGLLIEPTPEGLRIQILDRLKLRLFEKGGATFTPRGRHVLAILGSILARMPNDVAVAGHARAAPKLAPDALWELSGNRASNAQKLLAEFGVDDRRFQRIVGKGDTDPLDARQPTARRNDRVSILLLLATPPQQGAKPARMVAPPAGG